jgi:GTP-binding protein
VPAPLRFAPPAPPVLGSPPHSGSAMSTPENPPPDAPDTASDTAPPLPRVAIVGRPNVGKSSLFNRLTGRRLAIVLGEPGVTRDRHYAEVTWGRLTFRLVDTGGVDLGEPGVLGREVGEQSLKTIAEATVVLFMTDARDGLLPADREIADALRRRGAPVIHLVNKADTGAVAREALESTALGFDPTIPVSADHGLGLDDLYDALAERLPVSAEPLEPAPEAEARTEPVRVAVLGRPNTGKSTLVNRLLGEERLVVSDVPGTTRDAIDSEVRWRGTPYLFIDTAGMRRRGRIARGVERISVDRTMKAVERAEVAVLLMDAVEGVTDQDTKIAGLVLKAGRACVLAVNKWDLRQGEEDAQKRYGRELARHFPFLAHAPVIYMAGATGYHLPRLFSAVDKVAEGFRRRVATGPLNREIERLVARQPPPLSGGKPVRVYYATQVGHGPPRFVLFANRPKGLPDSYLRYLENGLREAFDLAGTPVLLSVRAREQAGKGGPRRGGGSRRRT